MQVDINLVKTIARTVYHGPRLMVHVFHTNGTTLLEKKTSCVCCVAMCFLFGGCADRSPSSDIKMATDKPVVSTPTQNTLVAFNACDDLPIVTVEERYDDGQLSLRQQVVIGEDGEQIPHGLMTYYWQNGNKKLEMEYHCGFKHGFRAAWHRDGNPWSVGEHRYGKDHGEWIVWYANGEKQQQFSIDNGIWNGPFTSWHLNNQKKMSVQYVGGQREGPLRLWDDRGNLLREIHYADDKVQPSPR